MLDAKEQGAQRPEENTIIPFSESRYRSSDVGRAHLQTGGAHLFISAPSGGYSSLYFASQSRSASTAFVRTKCGTHVLDGDTPYPVVSTLLITLKGILPLAALAEPAVAAGLCPTPQQGASPLHPFLRSPLGKRSGVHPDRSALASLDRDASRSSRFRGRLRRTLTLHLSFSGKDRSSHDEAERGARGTAGRSPRIRSAQGEAPCPLQRDQPHKLPRQGQGISLPLCPAASVG